MILGTDGEFTFSARTEGENLLYFHPISENKRLLIITYTYRDKFGNLRYELEYKSGGAPDTFSTEDIASYYEANKEIIHRDARQLIFNQSTES